MTSLDERIDKTLKNLINAKQAAIEAAQESDPLASSAELVAPANALLDKLEKQANQEIKALVDDAEQTGRDSGFISATSFCGFSDKCKTCIANKLTLEYLVALTSEKPNLLNPDFHIDAVVCGCHDKNVKTLPPCYLCQTQTKDEQCYKCFMTEKPGEEI